MKLIIFVQLFYRDYERSRDFRGGGASQSAISLRNQRWLIGLLMIFGSFTSSVNVIESVFCGVPRLPQPRGSVRPRVPRLLDAAKAACWSTRDREARRLELTPGSDSVGTQSLTSLLTSMHFCVRTVIAHQWLLRPLLNC